MHVHDATAIVAYLRTLEPVANTVPPSRVPPPLRLAMRMMPHRAVLRTDTVALSGVAYGRYLTQLAGCADCHTKRTMGNLVKKAPFAGGMAVSINDADLGAIYAYLKTVRPVKHRVTVFTTKR